MGPKTPGRRGFTLIEMLITLSLFAMVVSALLVGLHSAVRAWRSVRTSQTREAGIAKALDLIGADIRHVAVLSEEMPALAETSIDQDSEELTVTRVGARCFQRAGAGEVWCQVTYRVRKNEDTGAHDLVRLVIPGISTVGMDEHERQELLLKDVESIRFDYFGSEGILPKWEDRSSLPSGIRVTIEPTFGKSIAKAVWLPCGALRVGT